MQIPRPCGVVSLLTDFGQDDPWVGVMKGVVKQHDLRADVVDFCHGVPAHDVTLGAFYLAAAIDRFPAGTVHVAVVDPGVGTGRRLLAVCAAGCFWLAPDNGLLQALLDRDDAEVRVLDLDKLRLLPASRTFHGRDVLAPVAGMLSGARFGFRALGERCRDAVRLPEDPLAPEAPPRVLAVDRFGNLIGNVRASRVAREAWTGVRAGGRTLPLRATYADAGPGEAVALINSYDLLELAVNRGRAADVLRLGPGAPLEPVRSR
jgi:S-adenosylmethionine hydrolase